MTLKSVAPRAISGTMVLAPPPEPVFVSVASPLPVKPYPTVTSAMPVLSPANMTPIKAPAYMPPPPVTAPSPVESTNECTGCGVEGGTEMLASPNEAGNQTEMGGFTAAGFGNQTDFSLGPKLYGSVTQRDLNDLTGTPKPARPESKDTPGGASVMTTVAPPSSIDKSTKATGGHLDGNVFLLIVAAGVVAYAIWG